MGTKAQGSERQVSKERSRFDKIGFKLYAKPIYYSFSAIKYLENAKIPLKTLG